jgi:Acetyltransferase (GNAT) domain
MTAGSNGNDLARATLHDAADPSLAAAWQQCLARADSRSQFCSLGWYKVWLASIGGRRKPWIGEGYVVTAQAPSGETIGVLPLAVARYYGFRVVSSAGYFQPHRDPIWAANHEKYAAAAIVDLLLSGKVHWHLARLGPLDVSVPGNLALLERFRARAPRVEVRMRQPTIFLSEMPDSFGKYQEQVLGLKFAKQIQYYSRKAVREAGMKIRHAHDPKGELLDQCLRDCRQIENRSWLTDIERPSLRFATDLDFEFWRQLSKDGLVPGVYPSFWIMDLNDRPSSYCVTLTAGGVRYTIANQYDDECAKYRTGSTLYFHMFEDAYACGVRAVDFGSGSLHYKSRWGGIPFGQRADVIVFAGTPSGRVLGGARGLYSRCRQLAGALRDRKPTPVAGV